MFVNVKEKKSVTLHIFVYTYILCIEYNEGHRNGWEVFNRPDIGILRKRRGVCGGRFQGVNRTIAHTHDVVSPVICDTPASITRLFIR